MQGTDGADHAGRFGPDVYAAWRVSSLGDITEALEHALIFQLAGPLHGRRALDVGCGDGTLALALAHAGASRVAGCDVDPRMVARARTLASGNGSRLDLAVAQVQALPFPAHSFDLVTCITMLAFVADADAAIREMARVLRPGGRLIIGDLNKWSVWAARRRIRGWFGAALWRSAHFRTAGTLEGIIRRAGLVPDSTRGAIFFPPWTAAARVMAPYDARLGAITTAGAAFVAIAARKPPSGPGSPCTAHKPGH